MLLDKELARAIKIMNGEPPAIVKGEDIEAVYLRNSKFGNFCVAIIKGNTQHFIVKAPDVNALLTAWARSHASYEMVKKKTQTHLEPI